MATIIDLQKKNDGVILVLTREEAAALELLLGSLTTERCLELGLSKREDATISNIYCALPDRDDLL